METIRNVKIYIDIETFAGEEKPSLDSLKADGRLTDPEKIKADLLKKQDEAWRKQALDPTLGEVFCIGMAVNDEPAYCIVGTDEHETMDNFRREIKQYPYPTFIAHNGIEFDFRFLFVRGLKYGMRSLVTCFSGKHGVSLIDTTRMMDGPSWKTMTSLDKMCKLFGLEGKGDITGADVHDMILTGQGDAVCKYCISDVEKLRACYKKLSDCGITG